MWLRAKKRVYLDWAAAAPVSPRVGHVFQKALLAYGNPGALHAEAVAGKKILEDARARIARLAEVKSSRVIFTSGATEANALGILGVVHLASRQAVRRVNSTCSIIQQHTRQ